VRRWAVALLVIALLGCGGQPDTHEEKAEAVASIAAEGSLLAHDAGEGSTLRTFTAEHAKALRKSLHELPSLDDPDLERARSKVDTALARLEAAPGDRARARQTEQQLEDLAKAAEAIGKRS
jgi:hypothetical protein